MAQRTFSVVVEKTPAEKLGIEIDVEQNHLIVTRVAAEGIIPSWNEAHPQQAVKVGDQIYGANNVSGHGPDIVDQLKNNGWITMEISRPPPDGITGPAQSSGAPPNAASSQRPPRTSPRAGDGPGGSGGPITGPGAGRRQSPASGPALLQTPTSEQAPPTGGDALEVPKKSTLTDSGSIRPGETMTSPPASQASKLSPFGAAGNPPYIRQAPAKAAPGSSQAADARSKRMQDLMDKYLEGTADQRAHPHDHCHDRVRATRNGSWCGRLGDPFYAIFSTCSASCSKDCCGVTGNRQKSWSDDLIRTSVYSEEKLPASALKQPAAAELRHKQ